jgi:medium-chain acyl-[acyl-carrier-protein] hydrolase
MILPTDHRWLPREPDPAPPLRLFCFPHAGAGASTYRPWVPRLAGDGVQVCPVQLPGRENRFGEPAYQRLEPLLEALVPALTPSLEKPFAFFGHSLGALIAFELARSLRSAGLPAPVHLFVSGRIAPQSRDPRPTLHDQPESALRAALAGLGGMPQAVLDHPALMALQLPLIRADLAVNETYRYVPGPPLDVPISAYGGNRDPKVGEDELRAWEDQAGGDFRARRLPGDHFFVQSSLSLLLHHLLADLDASAGWPAARGA